MSVDPSGELPKEMAVVGLDGIGAFGKGPELGEQIPRPRDMSTDPLQMVVHHVCNGITRVGVSTQNVEKSFLIGGDTRCGQCGRHAFLVSKMVVEAADTGTGLPADHVDSGVFDPVLCEAGERCLQDLGAAILGLGGSG